MMERKKMLSIHKRRQIDASTKAKVALAAIKGNQTVAQICSTYDVHSTRVSDWKKQAIEGLPTVFSRPERSTAIIDEKLTASLYEEIGRLKVELDWLKKKLC
jgi:putative transposase